MVGAGVERTVSGDYRESHGVNEVPVRVWRVGRSSESRYLLVLRDDSGAVLPMAIGPCEAVAIWAALRRQAEEEAEPPAPGTHDLLCALIERLGGRLTKVVIDDLWNQKYYAKLHVARNGEVLTIDARPSDSVAMGLRANVPLFAAPSVLEAANADEDADQDAAPPDEDLSDL